MNHSGGYTVETAEARIDLKDGSAEGNKTVLGHGPAGTLRSEGFRILDNGQVVRFTGKARLVINANSAEAKDMVPGMSELNSIGSRGGGSGGDE